MTPTNRPVAWPKSGWYWHLHHDRLIEWTDDIDERWDFVVTEKPKKELEMRLRLMRPVVGPMPAELDKANAECMPAIKVLHAVECPGCPWDGETILELRRVP